MSHRFECKSQITLNNSINQRTAANNVLSDSQIYRESLYASKVVFSTESDFNNNFNNEYLENVMKTDQSLKKLKSRINFLNG